jgi:hypothetical protein
MIFDQGKRNDAGRGSHRLQAAATGYSIYSAGGACLIGTTSHDGS